MKKKPGSTVNYVGHGDPRSTLDLLWGNTPETRRGPRRSLTTGAVGVAALELADEGGLAALSMRNLGARLGVAAMALYRYVPTKDVLLELVLEAAYAQLPDELPVRAAWPERLRIVATDAWELYLAHPWMLQISVQRPSLGPHAIRKYERELKAIEPAGLPDVEMDLVIASVSDFVRGSARSAIEAASAPEATGVSDRGWWEAHAEHLGRLVSAEQFPLAVRVGAAAGEAYGGATDPKRTFAFGLERLIGGIVLHVQGKSPRRA
jgi:AcrR family transcriptional regulator